ncbi:MAG TPA: M14 family zinc carboxypeptidase [Bryobacteraceae bacterium]|nr:M14 family zinc carboxypeptidase [Bryobacteraceae bacterium]
MPRTAALVWVFLAGGAVCAQKAELWPGAVYDPRIPTFRQVLGYDAGERITPHAGILRYLEALAAASPRIRVFEYGESWEGRKLVYAAIGSESNLRRLEEIRAGMERLADPRKTPEAEARRLMATLPVVVWLAYGVHGNEISSPDAALATAYHLLAAKNDALAERILTHTLVLLDPVQNPDGRDRFIRNFEEALGLAPDASRLAAEHNEPWPGGRTNHYLFDLNRDWITLTQPETRGIVKALLAWYPLVFTDLHEMGMDSTYYFTPEADPYNPHLTADQRGSLQLFGRNDAKWFDHFGFDYFTREIYDAFYPGYGASWPAFYGAVAMTYEQASTRGLVVRRNDETVLRFRDTVRRHLVASLATAETAAANREKLLADFYRYRSTAIAEGGREAVRTYILPRGRDAAATDKLAGILMEQGVEVRRATAAFRAGDREYPAGTYVVPLAQPAKRLIRTLLDPVTPMDEAFVLQEEARRRRKLRSEIYDVTAWSLPLVFNVEAVARPEAAAGSFEAARPGRVVPGEVRGGKAAVAYLAPWGSAAGGRLLAAALRQDLRLSSSDKPFTLNGVKYPAGTLIFKVAENPPDLGERLARLAAATGAEIHAANSSWVEEGVNFGSRYVVHVRKPVVAMAWDQPVSANSAGWARFVLERQYGYPVTVVRTAQLAGADLSRLHVLLLPAAENYQQALGSEGIDRLKDWVDAGGTLIALAPEAVEFLADRKVGLLDVAPENAVHRDAEAAKPDKDDNHVPGRLLATREDYERAVQAEREAPDRVPGVLVRARVNADHWITDGAAETVVAMVQGRAIFTPIKRDKGVNAAIFEAPDKLLASGYLWEESRRQLAYKPLLLVEPSGRGMVIGFTADPNYRGSLDGMNLLFLNAVFRGPAHARPMGSEE